MDFYYIVVSSLGNKKLYNYFHESQVLASLRTILKVVWAKEYILK